MIGQAALTFILTVFILLTREDLRNRAIWLFGDGQVTTTTKVAEFRPDAVVVAPMPPGGVAHASYLISRLRQHFAELKLLVCHWSYIGGTVAVSEARIPDTDGIDRTLADTRKRLAALHLLLPTAESAVRERKEDEHLVGTASA